MTPTVKQGGGNVQVDATFMKELLACKKSAKRNQRFGTPFFTEA